MDEHRVARPQNSFCEFKIYGALSGARMIHWVAQTYGARRPEINVSADGRVSTRSPPRQTIRAH
jgi:hypothetical protein